MRVSAVYRAQPTIIRNIRYKSGVLSLQAARGQGQGRILLRYETHAAEVYVNFAVRINMISESISRSRTTNLPVLLAAYAYPIDERDVRAH